MKKFYNAWLPFLTASGMYQTGGYSGEQKSDTPKGFTPKQWAKRKSKLKMTKLSRRINRGK